jgi:putative transposase
MLPASLSFIAASVRYIELNPVRARLGLKPEDYQWSSARAHIFRTKDEFISENDPFLTFDDWSKFLHKGEPEDLSLIRKHA